MLKAVLFDMDGVLVDSEPEYQKVDARLARELGFELTPGEQSRYVGMGTLETWQDLKQKHGFEQEPLEVIQKEARLMAEYYAGGRLKPYAASVALLKSCAAAGFSVAVATSSAQENAERVVRRLGLSGDVNAVVSGSMVRNAKPAPDIFLLAMRLLDVNGEECIVVEDADSGVKAARAAGVKKVIGLRHDDAMQTLEGADLVVDSLDGITVETLRAIAE